MKQISSNNGYKVTEREKNWKKADKISDIKYGRWEKWGEKKYTKETVNNGVKRKDFKDII